jgi:hypothetical protein
VTVAGPPAQEPGATATPPPPPPCATCRARPARLGSRIAYDARVTRRYTVITKLLIQPAYTGTTVRLRCSGRGCRFTSKTRTVARQTRRLDLTTLVRGAKLRPGAELQIRVTRADRIGTMATLGIRARNRPRRITRCLFPGDPMPAACPPLAPA